MLKKIKEKLKKFKKWIIGAVIGSVALAAGVILAPEPIPSIIAEGQTISFPYAGTSTYGNLPIRTDRESYSGLSGKTNVDIYVMIENKSGKGQITNLQFYFPQSNITVNSIQTIIPNSQYQMTIDDFATTSVYYASTSKSVIITTKIGSHKETKVGNVWGSPEIIESFNPSENSLLLAKGNLTEQPKPNQRPDKRVQVPILTNGISYFKINIGFNSLGWQKHEFYIEAVGSEGAYSLLDPTLYDYLNTGDDNTSAIYGATQRGQTFTPSTSYAIYSVKSLVYRVGTSPGTITGSVYAADAAHKPTGSVLASGSLNGNNFTTDTPWAWEEFIMTTNPTLTNGTEYAITYSAPTGNGTNLIQWREDVGSTYPGYYLQSSDSGATWGAFTGEDFMFEIWGNIPVTGATSPVNQSQVIE